MVLSNEILMELQKKKDSVSLQLRPIVFLAEPVYCNKKATI